MAAVRVVQYVDIAISKLQSNGNTVHMIIFQSTTFLSYCRITTRCVH
jgi:hypothetical protein